jgi:hypothetical protein
MDLLAVKLCARQIADVSCKSSGGSDLIKSLDRRFDLYPDETAAGLVSFSIFLIPPGGEITVVAEAVEVTRMGPLPDNE